MTTKPPARRARNTAASEATGADVGAKMRAAGRQATRAAGIMNQTINRRGDDAFPADWIVDPVLRGRKTAGCYTQPGLAEAVEAVTMWLPLCHGSVRRACEVVARQMRNYWRTEAISIDLYERLCGGKHYDYIWDEATEESIRVARSMTTEERRDALAARLRTAYYADKKKRAR